MPAMTLDFDAPSAISIESQMQRLALEAGAIANVIDTFKNILPSLTEKLYTQFSSLKTEQDGTNLVETKVCFNNLKVKLPHASYINYNKTLVSVPEGFKGNLLSYIQTLSNMSTEVFQEANKTLGEYNFALSAFITNKESKISLKDHKDIFLQISKRREKLNDELSVYFPKGSNLSKAYLGETIHRFTDLEIIIQQAEKLNIQRKAQNIKDISESVNKSVELLKIIIEDTRNNGIDKVSGNAAMNISTGAYEIGRYVEFIAIYRFRIEQVVNTVEKLIKTLDTII